MTISQSVARQVSRAMASVRQALRGVMVRNANAQPNIGVEVRGLAGEQVAGELFQHYGFTSAPLPGAECIVIPIGGNSSHAVVVATADGRYRLKVTDGEVALFTDEGDHIHFKRGREIEAVTKRFVVKASEEVVFDTPLVKATKDVAIGGNEAVTGNVSAQGQVSDGTRSIAEDREIFNQHDHDGDSGGKTSIPNQKQ